MNASTHAAPSQPFVVECDAQGRRYVVGPNGEHIDLATLSQVCARRAREMRRQEVDRAVDTALAALRSIATAVVRRLAAALHLGQRVSQGAGPSVISRGAQHGQ